MKLTYTKQGDYLIPDITIRQPRKALGHYVNTVLKSRKLPEIGLMLLCRGW